MTAPDATYSLKQCPGHDSLWHVLEHYKGTAEPVCGWTTKDKAEALLDRLESAASRRAARES